MVLVQYKLLSAAYKENKLCNNAYATRGTKTK